VCLEEVHALVLNKVNRGNVVQSANFREPLKFVCKARKSGLLEINFKPACACTWTCDCTWRCGAQLRT
jgi:hypothetical protein